MRSKVEERLERPLALTPDGVKLVKREKWNRGDSLGPSPGSPGFDCNQSVSALSS
jgi:hypothetical protein